MVWLLIFITLCLVHLLFALISNLIWNKCIYWNSLKVLVLLILILSQECWCVLLGLSEGGTAGAEDKKLSSDHGGQKETTRGNSRRNMDGKLYFTSNWIASLLFYVQIAP